MGLVPLMPTVSCVIMCVKIFFLMWLIPFNAILNIPSNSYYIYIGNVKYLAALTKFKARFPKKARKSPNDHINRVISRNASKKKQKKGKIKILYSK